jgi:agmatinase
MPADSPDPGNILDLLENALPFAGLPTFLRKPYTRDVSNSDLVVMGVPFDGGCTNRVGARHAPRALREQSLYAGAFQPVYPWDHDLSERYRITDFGDVVPMPGTGAIEYLLEATEAVAAEVFDAGAALLTLGGDHTLPYGPIRAAHERFGQLSLLHFDSHQDSADSAELGGDLTLINHGTFATGVAKEGLVDVSRSAQLYIRTHMPATPVGDGYTIIHAEDALDAGPTAVARRIRELVGDHPVYLTFDVDTLDPADAPGTGSPVPCGPSGRDIRRLLRALDGINLVGADITELNPLYDPAETTTILSAFLCIDLLHLLGTALTQRRAAAATAIR